MDAKGKATSCSELFGVFKNGIAWHYSLRIKSGVRLDIYFIKILSVLENYLAQRGCDLKNQQK